MGVKSVTDFGPAVVMREPDLERALTRVFEIPIDLPPLHRSDFGGTKRYGAVAAAIGGKIYVGTGYDGANKKDWWEYDPTANTWTQKTDFGGTARHYAVAAAINGKIYVGTGYDGAYRKDWWEYDPTANTWTQKTDFGGTARYYAVAVAINGKVYVGTGHDGARKIDWWWQNK